MNDYELIRSDRRTLAVEITRDARVVVRAPKRLSQRRIEDFLAKRAGWIQRHLEESRRRMAAAPPPPDGEELQTLREQAGAYIPQRVRYWSGRTGLVPTGVRITAARKRYGSCSGKDSLCFSCLLMRCPPEAIDLVVVHELCHIREKNHGPRFYALLESFLPDWRARKSLLNG